MHGLPQARNLANGILTSRLDKFGYSPCQYTPGIWRQKGRPIVLSLVVDDFSVKCEGIQHAWHRKEALKTYHEVSVYWNFFFCGVSLDWDYKGRMLYLSIPRYISKEIIKYQHAIPLRKQHQP